MFENLIEKIAGRPRAYVLNPNLDSAISLVVGLDCATDFALLIGFKEWLVLALGYGKTIAWIQLLEEAVNATHKDAPPEERFASALRLVVAFLTERSQHRGARAIFKRYAEWELSDAAKQG